MKFTSLRRRLERELGDPFLQLAGPAGEESQPAVKLFEARQRGGALRRVGPAVFGPMGIDDLKFGEELGLPGLELLLKGADFFGGSLAAFKQLDLEQGRSDTGLVGQHGIGLSAEVADVE